MDRPWLLIVVVASASAGVLVAAWMGWFGALLACGPEGATLCIAWPRTVAALVLILFLGCCVGLGAWHVAEWRRDPIPVNPDD